jgi:hypothetical protein
MAALRRFRNRVVQAELVKIGQHSVPLGAIELAKAGKGGSHKPALDRRCLALVHRNQPGRDVLNRSGPLGIQYFADTHRAI